MVNAGGTYLAPTAGGNHPARVPYWAPIRPHDEGPFLCRQGGQFLVSLEGQCRFTTVRDLVTDRWIANGENVLLHSHQCGFYLHRAGRLVP